MVRDSSFPLVKTVFTFYYRLFIYFLFHLYNHYFLYFIDFILGHRLMLIFYSTFSFLSHSYICRVVFNRLTSCLSFPTPLF